MFLKVDIGLYPFIFKQGNGSMVLGISCICSFPEGFFCCQEMYPEAGFPGCLWKLLHPNWNNLQRWLFPRWLREIMKNSEGLAKKQIKFPVRGAIAKIVSSLWN